MSPPPICMRTQYNAPYRLDGFECDDGLSIPEDLVAKLHSVEGSYDPTADEIDFQLSTDLRAHAGRTDLPPVWPASSSMAGSLLHRLTEAARRHPLRRAGPFLLGTLQCAAYAFSVSVAVFVILILGWAFTQ